MLRQEVEEVRRTPKLVETDEELRQELDDMSREARQSGEELQALRTL